EQIDFAAVRDEYEAFAARIQPMVCDTALLVNGGIRSGKRVMFEGAQGTMLDIDHGTYPFVTSSSATAGGLCTGTGVPPTSVQGVIGVSKAYITRVGSGPFPTEDKGASGDELRRLGHEFGSVTGRPRRCGWFDVPLLRYTAMVNGFDSMVITKLDVLDGLAQIPVCVDYRLHGRVTEEMPAIHKDIEALEPVYEYLPGWQSPTTKVTRCEDLPEAAQRYLEFLESRTGVEVGCISTGPERNQTMVRGGSKLEKLLGRAKV
ncbi:MAG: adenylosuccinate synthetase, partial [Bryobacteraceae bacterium]